MTKFSYWYEYSPYRLFAPYHTYRRKRGRLVNIMYRTNWLPDSPQSVRNSHQIPDTAIRLVGGTRDLLL